MAVQKHRLHPRQQGVGPVEMSPARLDHSDLRIGEEVNRVLQKIRRRNEVGVQNADEIALGRGQTSLQRARLETDSINAMNQLHIQPARLQFVDTTRGQLARVIGGIIQHLDLEQLARVIDFADRFQQTLDHVDLVKDRQLHRHFR